MQRKQKTRLVFLTLFLFFWISKSVFAADFSVTPVDGGISVTAGRRILSEEAGYTLFTRGVKRVALALYGCGVITAILAFFFSVSHLGFSGDDAGMRARALRTLLFRAGILSLLGGITVVTTFFWNLF